MSIPITQGQLQTSVDSMNIGDYIVARYSTTALTSHGAISEIGTADTAVLPAFTNTVLDGYIYLIKIAKGVLVANSPLYSGVTYTTMNAVNRIYGDKNTISGKDYLVRVPNFKEYLAMCGTLNGKLDVADRYTNFYNSLIAGDEVTQENYNLTGGSWQFVTTPAAISTNGSASDAARYARLVLEFAEDSKCTDLYH